jgi:hypothetical protein
MFSASKEVPEKCRAICADLEEILTLLFAIVGEVGFWLKMELVGKFWLANVNRPQELEKREELKSRTWLHWWSDTEGNLWENMQLQWWQCQLGQEN